MAGLPAALTLPLAVSSLAYLNARTNFTQDVEMLKCILVATVKTLRAFKKGRANMFYTLEEHAMSPTKGSHPFIALPPSLPKDAISLPIEEVKAMKGREYSYREVYDTVLKYAEWLKTVHGVNKDDIVALDCGNKPIFVFVWFAIWSLGARPAFINTSLRGEGFCHCVKTSTAKVLILDGGLKEVLTEEVSRELASMGPGVSAVVLDEDQEGYVMSLPGHRACDDCRAGIEPTGMSTLIFTSGTTGLPKPAVVTWKRYFGSAFTLADYLEFTASERYYTALPLYHSSASMLGLGVALASGTTLILSPHFSTKSFFPSLLATRATTVQYIGEMCRYLLSVPRSPYDTAHTIQRFFGNGIRPDVWRPFKERFAIPQIAEFYGATESPSSTFIKSRNLFGEGAIGRRGILINALTGSQNCLVKHDVETGEPVRDPATGLCVRADTNEAGELLGWLDPKDVKEKFAGYWGNEKATKGKILRDVLKKGDAYFRTGDLLRTDKEGRTFFVDRIGDTFRWKGENVSTGEVEKVVSKHPAVQEVNVYGVQLPGHDGRAGCAAVVFKGDVGEGELRSLAEYVGRTLPRFAAPLFLRRVYTMDTTGTNKYQKHGLRTQGVEPSKVGEDRLYWLDPKSGVYKEFGDREWQTIVGGETRL
ncbi:Fatty acid transporter protein [Elsinoe australis]|uniref:Very long-chain fatty acid transport protein n=1 Tax=Elsinoe australis TaxID=40998 RepID=A0A2P7YDP0_9PEZI|nr:Fatty acid transporter protein [Elsinoe australis]